MSDLWNVEEYLKFLDARTRPAHDLLGAVPISFQPKIVYDLGCGPGNSTILLKDRWSEAKVVGLDSSLKMLQKAKKSYPNIDFIQEEIQNFFPEEKIDCLFANASLHWLDQHEILFPKLCDALSESGILAIQMPNNFHAPSHQVTIHILQSEIYWQSILKKLHYGFLTEPFYKLSFYYDLLTKLNMKNLQLWETEYYQEMPNYLAIFDWVKGTSLRPVLSTMDQDNQQAFANKYIKAVAEAYPPQGNQKILLPFKRVFMVACKMGA